MDNMQYVWWQYYVELMTRIKEVVFMNQTRVSVKNFYMCGRRVSWKGNQEVQEEDVATQYEYYLNL